MIGRMNRVYEVLNRKRPLTPPDTADDLEVASGSRYSCGEFDSTAVRIHNVGSLARKPRSNE